MDITNLLIIGIVAIIVVAWLCWGSITYETEDQRLNREAREARRSESRWDKYN